MSKYCRRFILASLFYLLGGALIGLFMAMIPSLRSVIRFSHAHIMLVGWISMIIFGLGYHIIPRFAGSPLVKDFWQGIHWWLANIGLLGLVILPHYLLPLFGFFQFAGIVIFVANMFRVLRYPQHSKVPSACCPPKGNGSIVKLKC